MDLRTVWATPDTSSADRDALLYSPRTGGGEQSLKRFPPKEGKYTPWVVAATLATTVGAIALRVWNPSSKVRALSNIGIGFGAQSFLNCFFSNRSRVQQIALTTAGQTTFYLVTQLWEWAVEQKIPTLPAFSTSLLLSQLGVTASMYIQDLIHHQFVIRNENALPAGEAIGPTLDERSFLSHHLPRNWRAIKVATATACAVAWVFAKRAGESVYTGMASFLTLYYAAEWAGQKVCNLIDRKIQEATDAASNSLKTTRWRILKIALLTLSFVGSPLCWIPWNADPLSAKRIAQLPIIGGLIGFCEGIAFRSQEDRFKQLPLDQLDELHQRPPVESPIYRLAFRVWRVAWPLLIFTGVTVFSAYQWNDDDADDRRSQGAFYAGFGTFLLHLFMEQGWSVTQRIAHNTSSLLGKAKYGWSWFENALTAQGWDVEKRKAIEFPTRFDLLRDWWITYQNQPRLFGINPVHLYLLIVNSIAMHSGQEGLTDAHKGILKLAWFCYGHGTANELWQTLNERKGTVLQFTMLLVINAIMTAKNMGERDFA